ncbi:MAG: aldehyde-activating protein [Gammaproteobacteria bacterium]|nr:aldehyde-activating protein [Gammaproteobacteria bacterium]
MIKRIGDTDILEYHRFSCHCGAVVMELHLPDGVVTPRRCDCSLCRRRGAIAGTTSLDRIRFIKGEDQLRLYQFNTRVAKHYFCQICGIYTHHQRRSNPAEYGYNIACLEGVNPFALGDVEVMDGINHPSDRKKDNA